MSAFLPCNVKGYLCEMTPLLLVVLLASLPRTVLCQSEDPDNGDEVVPDEEPTSQDQLAEGESFLSVLPTIVDATLSPDTFTTQAEYNFEDHGSATDTMETPDEETFIDSTSEPLDETLNPTIILVPVVLVVVIIAMVVGGIMINRRWNQKKSDADARKKDSYLDDNSTERVPMPMFEEDVPSVLELEMEELEEWINGDGGITMDSKLT